ncbi:L-aspartate oxidase [Camelimonas fluminis]|uniref:L-aspartate oxidase n=1 Tax=Camelimonas fluminis TaxID=1576911 RepID=A0ABV7UHQ2_9HYPH|nr:L-aspartate oxidase [Camelimonas fluminis]GHE69760.1 L-aspartate oxidase [Camelimonas fluminis]
MPTRPSLATLADRPVIVGAGVAGLMTALQLAPMPCVLVSSGPIDAAGCDATSSSILAQGGLAAAIGPDDDVALHLADTLAAGDGYCDEAAAAAIIAAAPEAITDLLRLGARFDRDNDSHLAAFRDTKVETTFAGIALGLEAAHSRRRILHANGDASGAEVMRALAAAVRAAPHVTMLEGVIARDILTRDGVVTGVALHDIAAGGASHGVLATGRVVLATGGLGGLFACTTNPLSSLGAGVALAARAGAAVADMEFVQFHPTALDPGQRGGRFAGPAPLISEAVRGEGARLINDLGVPFMAGAPGEELAPRDVVARAIWRQQQAGRRVFLDARARPGAGFASRFPAIAAICAAAGLDPARDLLPVTPAAHYHMGGVAVDLRGRATLPGLWACGEVACTGLHGANRLASNSLVEALVCAKFVASDLKGTCASASTGVGETAFRSLSPGLPGVAELAQIRTLMSRCVGLERNADGLRQALASLWDLAGLRDPAGPRSLASPRSLARLTLPAGDRLHPAADAALVGLLITHAALARQESRGAHFRSDFSAPAQTASRRAHVLLADVFVANETSPVATPAPISYATKIAS